MDEKVTGHHEQAPHQHADGVGEGHEDPELFAAGKDHDDAGDEFGRADEWQEELGFQDGHHKGLRLGFRVAGSHDRGVAPVDVVQVFGSGAQKNKGVEVPEHGVKSWIHVAQVLQFELMFDETWATARQSQASPNTDSSMSKSEVSTNPDSFKSPRHMSPPRLLPSQSIPRAGDKHEPSSSVANALKLIADCAWSCR